MAARASDTGNRIIIVKGAPLQGGEDLQPHPRLQLLQLPNPSTGQQQQYVVTSEGLLEVNRIKHAASSWLVGETFVSDGSAYLATPINPVFVLLALLNVGPQQPAGMFQEVESLLCCEQWPDAQQLLPLARQHLPCICDVKAVENDATYYRPSTQRVLACLRLVADRALAAFRSHSASSIAGLPQPEQQAYVIRFMRDYLSQAWFDKLASSYSLSPHSLSTQDTNVPAVRSAAGGNSTEKKPKVVDPKEAARKKAEESRAAAAAAKLQKQAAGSKKISQFFQATKKPPAK